MKRVNKHILYALTASLLMTTYACNEEKPTNTLSEIADSAITFIGSVESNAVLSTRASDIMGSDNNTYNEEEIYIWQQVGNNTPTMKTYKVAGGKQGRLETTSGEELKWESVDAVHEFYAWTAPNIKEENQVTGGVNMNTNDSYTGTVTFGTQEKTGLETFIVAHEGPISYKEWGQYVSLHFYHPVAKISVNSITHIAADGSTNPINSCTITFPNLASSATFTATNYEVKEEKYPPVLEATETKGITWEWRQDGGNDCALYVFPFKFSSENPSEEYYEQPSFFIITTNSGTYRGSLTMVNDPTELRAGDHLTMNLTVRDGEVSGMYSYITDWNTEEKGTVPQHRVPGIYTQADAQALLNALRNGTEIPAYLIDIDESNNTKTIRFFTHVDWNGATEDITIPEDYVLDGQGYNLTLPEGMNLYGVKGEGEDEAGNIKNLYVNGDEDEYTVVEEPDPDTEPDEGTGETPETPETEAPAEDTANT